MFKRGDQAAPTSPQAVMLIATVDALPGRSYEAIGTCGAYEYCKDETPQFAVIQQRMAEQARAMGGDAVIGVRFAPSQMTGKHLLLIGSGTVIRFTAQ